MASMLHDTLDPVALPCIIQDSVDALASTLADVTCEGAKYRGFSEGFSEQMLVALNEQLIIAQSRLKTIQNGIAAPISVLPPEVLEYIFLLTRPTREAQIDATEQPILQYHGLGKAAKTWHPIYLTAVCRYWRAISLQLMQLWSDISVGNAITHPNSRKTLAAFCYDRGRDLMSPLDLYIWSSIAVRTKKQLHGNEGVLQEWLTRVWTPAYSTRVRSLQLYGFEFENSLLETFSKHPAPTLEKLGISPPTSQNLDLLDLPSNLFAGQFPRLQHLHLRNVYSWGGNTFIGLSTLRLSNACDTLNYVDLYNLLMHSPALELFELQYEGGLAGEDTEATDDLVPITLPHLERLSLLNLPVRCVIKLLCDIIPSKTCSRCVNVEEHSNLSFYPDLDKLWSNAFILDCMHSITELSLFDYVDRDGQQLKGNGPSPVTLTANLEPSYASTSARSLSEKLTDPLCALVTACSKLSELKLWVYDNKCLIDEHTPARVLAAASSITSLAVGFNSCTMPALSKVLSAICSSADSGTSSGPCCQLLVDITLVVSSHKRPPAWGEAELGLIEESMRNKKSSGFPITRLHIRQHSKYHEASEEVVGRSTQWEERLREYVEEVSISHTSKQ